jgi:hypothetical protein
VKIRLQSLGALAPRGQALQDDVGRLRIVARTHRRITKHPIADGQLGRVGSYLAHPADAARAGDDGRLQQVAALAAEHFTRIGEHLGSRDVDDDLAGAQHGIGHGFDGERRAERLQDGCFHGSPHVVGWPIFAILPVRIQA